MKWFLLPLLLFSELAFGQRQVSFFSTGEYAGEAASARRTSFQEIPFELVNGMILVEAMIDHQAGTFILDTGSPMLVLNQRQDLVNLAGTAAGCSGSFAVGSIPIRHFGWSRMDKYDLVVLTADLRHLEIATRRPIRGLIGYQILKDWEVYLDYEQRRILLFDPVDNPLHRSAAPAYSAALTFTGHLPVIRLSIGGQTLRFGLDTGSEGNLIDEHALLRLRQSLIDTIDEEEIQGLDREVRTVPVVQISEVRLQQLPLEALPCLVTELCHLKTSARQPPDGLLGCDFLRRLKFSINYQKQEFYLWDWPGSM